MKETLKKQVINEINQNNVEEIYGIFSSKNFQLLSDEEKLEIYTAAKNTYDRNNTDDRNNTEAEQEELGEFVIIADSNKNSNFPVFLEGKIEILKNKNNLPKNKNSIETQQSNPIRFNKKMENNTDTEGSEKEDEDFILEKNSTHPKKQPTEHFSPLSKEKYNKIEAYIKPIVANNKKVKTSPTDYEKLKIVINCTGGISAEEIYQYLTTKLARANTLDKSLKKTKGSVSITGYLVNTLIFKFFPELKPRKRSHSNNDSRDSLNKRRKKNSVTTEKNTEEIIPSAETTLTEDEKEKFLNRVEEATREFYAQEKHKVSSNQCQYKSYRISINISELFPNDQDKWELLVSDFKKIHLPRGKEKRGIILSHGNVTINGYSTFRLAEKWEITDENRKNYKKPTSIDFLGLSSTSKQPPIEKNPGTTDFFKPIPKNSTSFYYEESPFNFSSKEFEKKRKTSEGNIQNPTKNSDSNLESSSNKKELKI